MAFLLPFELKLERYPKSKDPSLRAWSAADEYLLEYAFSLALMKSNPRILLVNDQFGALSISLSSFRPHYWVDSFLSSLAIEQNLALNALDPEQILPLDVTYQVIEDELSCAQAEEPAYDLVLIQIPKHLSLLEYQLSQIQSWCHDKTIVIAGGMTKHIHNSTLQLFEKNIGKTTTSLAKKKARLIFSEVENRRSHKSKIAQYQYSDKTTNLQLKGLPGVFCKDKLDVGTRVLLQYLEPVKSAAKVVDLGCGNGILGAAIAQQTSEADVFLIDESRLAVESAKLTFAANHLSNGHFIQADGLKGFAHKDLDLILCNPPFHQQNVQTISIATTMFKEAARHLNQDGVLMVVANRHLKYGPILSRYFSQVSPLSANPQFIVWRASKAK